MSTVGIMEEGFRDAVAGNKEGMPIDNAYKYVALAGQHQVRLIGLRTLKLPEGRQNDELTQEDLEQPLSVELIHVDLDDVTPSTAMSYMWGISQQALLPVGDEGQILTTEESTGDAQTYTPGPRRWRHSHLDRSAMHQSA
jgi:hypothetical protein